MSIKLGGLNKGVNGWANDYVDGLPEDSACAAAGTVNISRPDFEQNILDLTEECAAYVTSKRFGASRAKALSACRGKIKDKMHCSVAEVQERSKAEDDAFKEKELDIDYWPYLIAFLFVGLIFYLLTSSD